MAHFGRHRRLPLGVEHHEKRQSQGGSELQVAGCTRGGMSAEVAWLDVPSFKHLGARGWARFRRCAHPGDPAAPAAAGGHKPLTARVLRGVEARGQRGSPLLPLCWKATRVHKRSGGIDRCGSRSTAPDAEAVSERSSVRRRAFGSCRECARRPPSRLLIPSTTGAAPEAANVR